MDRMPMPSTLENIFCFRADVTPAIPARTPEASHTPEALQPSSASRIRTTVSHERSDFQGLVNAVITKAWRTHSRGPEHLSHEKRKIPAPGRYR